MSVRYIYRKARWLLLFRTVDFLGGILHRPRTGIPDLAGARSILILKLDQAGDLLLTYPLLDALRRAAPRARIEIAVGEGRPPVLSGTPLPDRIHEFPVRLRPGNVRFRIGYRGLRAAMAEVRRLRFDVVIAAKEDPLTVLLAWLSGVRTRIGFREGGLGFLLSHTIPVPLDGTHQWRILAALGGSAGADSGPPRFHVPPAAAQEADRLLEELGVDRTLPLVVVHPGAGTEERCWPLQRFLDTVVAVSRARPCTAVVVRGPEEPESLTRSPAESDLPSRIHTLRTLIPFDVLAALLARADLLLGNESAPAHLAAAVDTPAVVAFFSDADPRRWGPAGPRHRIVLGPPGTGPSVDAMAGAALEALAAGRRTS